MGVASFRITQARARDAMGLLNLERTVLGEQRFFVRTVDEAPDLPAIDEMIAAFSERDNAVMFVARYARQVVGVIRLAGGNLARTRHSAKLEVLVHPDARGSGVGLALMESGLDWARETPAVSRVALCVFADNTRAMALYQRLGFLEEGRRVGEYRELDGSLRDDVLMALEV